MTYDQADAKYTFSNHPAHLCSFIRDLLSINKFCSIRGVAKEDGIRGVVEEEYLVTIVG